MIINSLPGSKWSLESSNVKEAHDEASTFMAQPDSKMTLPSQRVVRFQLDAEQALDELRRTLYAQHSFSAKRKLKKVRRMQRNIPYHPTWLTPKELQYLKFQCAQAIIDLDRRFTSTTTSTVVQYVPDDVGEILSLGRYITARRRMKKSVQKQLHHDLQIIQEFESSTGILCPDLIAESCQKITRTMMEMAHWEGMCLHMDVVKQEGKNETHQLPM
jgi:hypothetical protein